MNPYDNLDLDLIKSTPVTHIELYDARDTYNRERYGRVADLRHYHNESYVRLYLSDGEVLHFELYDIEFCLVQDEVLHNHLKEHNGGRLPWNTFPDIAYRTNRSRQKVGYLMDETCSLQIQHTPTAIDEEFAAISPTSYPFRRART